VDLISRLSGGAMRDALSILEVCAADGGDKNITFEYVSKVSGYFDTEKMVKLCVYIKDGDTANALRIFWEMYENSVDCNNFCASLLEMFRNIQVAKITEEPLKHINLEKSEAEKIIETAKDFDSAEILRCGALINEVIINLARYTVNKRVAVEMMLAGMCAGIKTPGSAEPPSLQKRVREQNANVGCDDPGAPQNTPRYFDKYADLIEETGKENKMIVPYLKSGKCMIDENAKKVVIYTDKEFHANILKDEKNIAVIQNNLRRFIGDGYAVAVELQKPDADAQNGNGNSIDDLLGYSE